MKNFPTEAIRTPRRYHVIMAITALLGIAAAVAQKLSAQTPWLTYVFYALIATFFPLAFVGGRLWENARRDVVIARRGLLCTKCGYDLSTIRDSQICPECGYTFNADYARQYWANKYVLYNGELDPPKPPPPP